MFTGNESDVGAGYAAWAAGRVFAAKAGAGMGASAPRFSSMADGYGGTRHVSLRRFVRFGELSGSPGAMMTAKRGR